MSYASCLAAAQTLLAAVPGIQTVADIDAFSANGIPPDAAPAVLVQEVRPSEDRAAAGYKERSFTIDCHLWGYYADTVDAPFRALVEGIESAFRQHPRLGGLADVPGASAVKLAGDGARGIQTQIDRYEFSGSIYIRHALTSVAVKEWING